jgi:hypothetical protein
VPCRSNVTLAVALDLHRDQKRIRELLDNLRRGITRQCHRELDGLSVPGLDDSLGGLIVRDCGGVLQARHAS